MEMKSMKKLVLGVAVAALMFGATVASATVTYTPGAGVKDSVHDMNYYLGVDVNDPLFDPTTAPDEYGRLCAYCHTPHHADQGVEPLWSRTLPTGGYAQYSSSTFDADNPLMPGAPSPVDQMAGPSLLCMSCHDGTIAVDTHYNKTGSNNLTGDNWGDVAISTTAGLSNDHPVGIDYDYVIFQESMGGKTSGIKPKTSPFIGEAGATSAIMIQDVLYNGTILTCASCHDVHNKDNTIGGTSFPYLLYGAQKDSGICLSCHNK